MTAEAFHLPRSIAEALDLLREHGDDVVVMTGGTLVMSAINGGQLFPRRLMSLKRAGIDQLRAENGRFEIGAAVTASRLASETDLPLLTQAAAGLGGPALRNQATIGGNLFAHAPYGDLGVALMALDAEVELTRKEGARTVPLADFFANGAAARRPDELVTALRVPRPSGETAWVRLGRRQAATAPVATAAVVIERDADGRCTAARIALGAAGSAPMRAREAEAALVGQPLDESTIEAAAQAAAIGCEPPTDALASSWYRQQMIPVVVRRALSQIAAAAPAGR